MSPKTLNLDKSVSDSAFRVFALLALQNYHKGKKTNLVQAPTRDLAEAKGCSHTAIRKWLKELALRGYIEKLGKARGKATYRLTSPVFESYVRVETAPGVASDVTTKNIAVLRDKKRACPKCKKVGRITSSAGVCDGCLAEWASRTA